MRDATKDDGALRPRRWLWRDLLGVGILLASLGPGLASAQTPAAPPAPPETGAVGSEEALSGAPGIAAWRQYQLEHATACVGDARARMAAPATWSVGAMAYEAHGARGRLSWAKGSPHPGQLRLGILSGIKEPDAATLKALEGFLAAFATAQVDAVLVGGDSGFSGMDLDKVFTALGKSELPILVIAGNNESRSKFNRSLRAVSETHPNVLNLDLMRVLQGPGFGVVSLPGYHLKAFASTSASCVHDDDDMKALPGLFEGVEGARVLLSHGPPLQKGKAGVDWVDAETGNVGSKLLARILAEVKPRLVVAGHILESGSRATSLSGRAAKPGKPVPALVLNPGQVSALPYLLSGGWLSHGTAALVTLEGEKVSWKRLQAPRP